MDVCAVCGVQATQFCSACKQVKYCGADHQRAHWKTHKIECRPFTICSTPELGRHLVATRDIQAKTIVFNETPLIVGPKWFLNEQEQNSPIVPCVGCFTPINIAASRCPKCDWPACSATCIGLENPKLHALECPILALGPGPSDKHNLHSLLDYYRIDALVVIKCLVLQMKYRKKWNELIDMQSHEAERVNSELYQDAQNRFVSYLELNFLNRLKSLEEKSNTKLLNECDTNILHKICGIIETNYMCIQLPTDMELSALFYNACMMEHSCMPNCYFTFDHKNGYKVSVTAGRDIQKGEHLKIMYTNMIWGTQMRQEHLDLTKHFVCRCNRCCDRTELDTFVSGLLCIGSGIAPCGGVQLPEDPLSQTSDWTCSKCSMKINSREVRYLMTQMSEQVDELLSKKPTVRELESLIDKLSQFLHKNHYHMFNLKHTLIQLYGNEPGYLLNQLSDDLLLRKIQLCRDLLDVCDKLDPYTIRLSLYVGVIMKELYTASLEFKKRNLDSSEMQLLVGGKELLQKAKDILEKESDTLQGSKLIEAISVLELN